MSALLFLDFDGVLNRIIPGVGYEPAHPGLNAESVRLMQEVVERLDLRVVVSSSWRTEYKLYELRAMLTRCGGDGLAAAIDDATPLIETKYARAQEIGAWMASNDARGLAFAIVDDAVRHFEHSFMFDHLVLIDGHAGFQRADQARVAAMVGQPWRA